ncbi:hypothetical protein RUND412_009250 [Rhizina undulata]
MQPAPITSRIFQRLRIAGARWGGAKTCGTGRRRGAATTHWMDWRGWVNVTNFVRVLWIMLVYWGERKIFEDAMEACQWENWERWPSHAEPHRLTLIADPQLVDAHTYPRRGLSLWATMFYADKFMARNYDLLQSELVPSTTIFLGDLFDGGREWTADVIHHKDTEKSIAADPQAERDWSKYRNEYWLKEAFRFEKIFPALEGRRTIRTLPGNHDLGIGNGIRESVAERFRTYFGETSRILKVGNHSFVLLDTVSLSNDQNPRIYNKPQEFLASLPQLLNPPATHLFPHKIIDVHAPPPKPEPQNGNTAPTILLTHVPLYRAPSTPCGPLRESQNPIPIRAGYQYQNVLTSALSNEILEATNAKFVFSGDDHDFCEVEHMNTPGGAREITVKSFSWTMGVRSPGFLAVSLFKPREEEGNDMGLQWNLCLLPDQIGIFLAYVKMLAFSVVALLFAEVAFALREEKTGMVLPIARDGGQGNGYGLVGRAEDDGTGKYVKPRAGRRDGRWRRVGWGLVGEFKRVAVVAFGWYVFLIWRW